MFLVSVIQLVSTFQICVKLQWRLQLMMGFHRLKENEVPTIISNLNAQLTEWLEAGKLQRVALVIMSKDAGEVSERWKLVPKLIARLRL
ncbi:mitotic spindle checkpoint protein MAD2-like isoform X4 [Lycium barbarum]|uniref:mitotic spindle checkpoint protein MAD2-like isoform X4 n=1 Tax=Lycium barbarum TaxID=112863 RepID=UPI00293E7570|nr:mitotic spindle checkpoint protein MAD2-like isoform X4 [Lycium barbarum]